MQLVEAIRGRPEAPNTLLGSPEQPNENGYGRRPLLHRLAGAVFHRTTGIIAHFELNGGVLDVESLAESMIDVFQNAAAFGRGNIENGHMAGQRVEVAAEAPDMQIVDTANAGNDLNGIANVGQGKIVRRAFQQDIQRLAHDRQRRPEDEYRNEKRQQWIDPLDSGEGDG